VPWSERRSGVDAAHGDSAPACVGSPLQKSDGIVICGFCASGHGAWNAAVGSWATAAPAASATASAIGVETSCIVRPSAP
jgi:dienelactone hydrolase